MPLFRQEIDNGSGMIGMAGVVESAGVAGEFTVLTGIARSDPVFQYGALDFGWLEPEGQADEPGEAGRGDEGHDHRVAHEDGGAQRDGCERPEERRVQHHGSSPPRQFLGGNRESRWNRGRKSSSHGRNER